MAELNIIKQNENPLFNRKEIQAEGIFEKVPSKEEATEMLCKQFSCEKDQLAIKRILGSFGINKFSIEANIYKTKEDKEKTEVKSKKQREAEKKAEEDAKKAAEEAKKKAEEEAAAAKAEAEKPAEEKTEEPAKEENKEEAKE